MRPNADSSSAAGFRGPHKPRSPAQRARDLRRTAKHNRELIDETLGERHDAWAAGQRDEYLSARQDDQLDELASGKRQLRREVYEEMPDLEGRPFIKHHPYRGDRS